MNRPLTIFGWTAKDEARAARIRAERGEVGLSEAERRAGMVERPLSWWVARSQSEEPCDVFAGAPRLVEPPCEG